jgi:arsenite methyltransferase
MLKFDEETSLLLENAYRGTDSTRRRLANFEMLDPAAGERLVDLGCGPGFMTAALANAVGERGVVHGVDPSEEMRTTASARCTGKDNVQIVEGSATAIPVDDGAADGVVSVQVFEYVEDVPAALREVRRVLRPGGRVVIGDIHFDSVVWHSADRARMRRMLEAWDEHLVDRALPDRMPTYLRDAGFIVERHLPFTMFTPKLKSDSFVSALMRLIAAYSVQRGLVEADEAQAFLDEQVALGRDGGFFFAATHFIVRARVPD